MYIFEKCKIFYFRIDSFQRINISYTLYAVLKLFYSTITIVRVPFEKDILSEIRDAQINYLLMKNKISLQIL